MLRSTTKVRLTRYAKNNELLLKLADDKCIFGIDEDHLKTNFERWKKNFAKQTVDDGNFEITQYIFEIQTYGADENNAGLACAKIAIDKDNLADSCVILSDPFEDMENIKIRIETVFEILDIDDTMFDYDIDKSYIIELIHELSMPDLVYLYLRQRNIDAD